MSEERPSLGQAGHYFIVTQERGGLGYRPVCTAPPGSPCNVVRTPGVLGPGSAELNTYDPDTPGACMIVDWLNDDPGLIPELAAYDFEIARVPFAMERFGEDDDVWVPVLRERTAGPWPSVTNQPEQESWK